MVTARFQVWYNGGLCFANYVITDPESVITDKQMSKDSFAQTEYREFETVDQAEAWLDEMEEKA